MGMTRDNLAVCFHLGRKTMRAQWNMTVLITGHNSSALCPPKRNKRCRRSGVDIFNWRWVFSVL